MRFNIIKKSYTWVIAGAIFIPIALYIFFTNMILSIQFTGGMELKVNGNVDKSVVKSGLTKSLNEQGYKGFEVNIGEQDGLNVILLKIPVDNDEKVNKLSKDIQSYLVDNKIIESKDSIAEVSVIGPSVGDYMKNTAVKATLLGILFMGVYILFAFSALKNYISPLLLALITMFTMIFDIALPSGAYGLLMHFNPSFQVDAVFIIAILTIMGYSINDTIIIFDRVRENFHLNEGKLSKGKITYGEIFEDSLWQTMRRSIGTVFATFLAVVAMYIFGTGMMKTFAFTFGLGIVFGSYSSIFISAPLAYILTGKFKQEIKD